MEAELRARGVVDSLMLSPRCQCSTVEIKIAHQVDGAFAAVCVEQLHVVSVVRVVKNFACASVLWLGEFRRVACFASLTR